MAKGITCTCGHSWNKSDSSKKDMNVCHICGKDNTMKDGGWLDKYNDGGPVQENYNDYSVSAPEGFVGDGYSNVGRNYSPAWGGQFQDGGFLQPNSYKLPKGIKVPYADSSSELAMSIGGEGGEPAYLIPSFKYGQPLKNPMAEYMLTGEHLGGPFKTWQEADKWEQDIRHPYVEKGQPIPTPIKTWGDMAMGGSMPGAVGFTYARTGDIPSNGPYAKKTMASAQNGMEMKYYQNGLDFKPKSISKNGSVIKDDMGQWNHPGEITEIGSNQITMQGVPYPVLGVSDTGDMQMMYPNKEYQYKGSSVTEYPMAQDGMQVIPGQNEEYQQSPDENEYWQDMEYLDLSINNPIKPAVVNDVNNFIPGMADKFDTMRNAFDNKNTEFYTNWDKQNTIDISKAKNIKLNTGRFRGAKVPNTIIDDLAKTSREQNVPLGQLLTLMGRESTFGSGTQGNKLRMESKQDLMSGWNVAEQYLPYQPERFLADNKVPGVKATATPHGYMYELTNESKMNDYLRKNPKLLKQYQDKIDSTKALGNQDAFDLAAQFLKKKGIQGYNPGDPGYVNDFNKDYNLLKQDKALMNYVNQKGYKFEEGGSLQLTKLDQLTNFTNYNTKQPGGWLSKYE